MPAIANNKFVIVGGASLLGSNIARQLLCAGAGTVVLLDNLSLGSPHAIEDMLADPRCTFVRGDMLRLNELLDAFKGTAGVFNVAGFLGGPLLANPWMGLDVNVRGFQNVLEAARVQGVEKVIFSSSMGVYGRITAQPCTEDAPFDWNGLGTGLALYSGTKIVGEGLCQHYHTQYGLGYAALRYSNLYGENQHRRAIDATRIVNAWERIRAGEPPVIEGDGTNVADFIYIGDAARANLAAMEAHENGAYNITSGVDTPFNTLIAALLKACGSDLVPQYRADAARIANPVVTRIGASNDKARRELGWVPEVDIEEGMRRLVAWLDRERATGRI
ncbi:NAD-dependent epimerase/dehydratase family protein [Rhodobacter lacus]|uniref:NAD-dependent epimerase/dehydratase family protein n=1 Tax=Rhodobacter lacus TaxID=1641972 RepID=A0ABW5AB33_9RHOB